MKNIFAVLVIISVLLSLAACAAKQENSQSVPEPVQSEDILTPDAEEDTPAAEETPAAEDTSPVEETPASEDTSADEGDADYYAVATSYSKKEVEEFAAKVRSLILDKNWEELSKLMSFPVYVSGEEVKSAEDFVKLMNETDVSEDFFKAVETEKCVDMFANSHGIMFGSGEVWIAEYLDSIDEEKGTLYVIALNLV